MSAERHLAWEGLYNARDLGGLPLRDGGETRWRTTVRADNPERLTKAAWAAVQEYGIRTRIDLRNPDEIKTDICPSGIATIAIALDKVEDREFWDEIDSAGLTVTPLYYKPFLDRFPEQVAKVCTAIAQADGGVLFHCAAGRDRTGLVSLVLLALAGVDPKDIAADYALSHARLEPAWADLNLGDQTAAIEKVLARHNTTGREAIISTLSSLDAAEYLVNAGMTSSDIDALCARLT
jgi:protein-tyrosine phosphatase